MNPRFVNAHSAGENTGELNFALTDGFVVRLMAVKVVVVLWLVKLCCASSNDKETVIQTFSQLLQP